MTRLITARELAERYQCSIRTAQRYMRKMDHMEKPLRVTEQAVACWEAERSRDPDAPRRKAGRARKITPAPEGRFLIPRVRPCAGK